MPKPISLADVRKGIKELKKSIQGQMAARAMGLGKPEGQGKNLLYVKKKIFCQKYTKLIGRLRKSLA